MVQSKAGSILLLISSIITFLVAIVFLIFAVLAIFSDSVEGSPWVGFAILFVISILVFVIGGLKLWASKLMKVPATTKKGGIIALVVGILTGGDLLAIIGGVFGIIQGGQ
jgi:uncharacterized membrane protein